MAKKNFKKASGKSYEKSHAKKPQDPNLVKAKKFLGQHFLEDETVAQRIAETLTGKGYKSVGNRSRNGRFNQILTSK